MEMGAGIVVRGPLTVVASTFAGGGGVVRWATVVVVE
jgi:hypothetical protein